jgi:hypothetical protein
MAAGTSKHLKKVKAAADNGMRQLTEVVPKERITAAKTTTRKKVTTVLCDDPVEVNKNKVKHPDQAVQPSTRFH